MSDQTETTVIDETPAPAVVTETPAVTPEPVVETPVPAVDWATAFWERIAADAATYQI